MRKWLGGSAVKDASSREVPDSRLNVLGGTACDEVSHVDAHICWLGVFIV
eukprot:CAMPEP_0184287816 /NCGR_PEP_ID=MMETSP1049-20130417/221_1 /TAXON_ID=77928 /ORGANISM="Proteomonas sulcata, Strain CCMP704" /LENGTH=49 /DNA_ID=CAMNT_0026593885 /DNA_START=118 /DNA_END=267 /DNA_ORIENTATION=+